MREKATGYEQTTTELLTVADSPLNIELIAESTAFKPALPFSFLVVTETPGGEPVEAKVAVSIYYFDEDYSQVGRQLTETVETKRGTGLLQITPPKGAVRMTVEATSGDKYAWSEVGASYSPSSSFVHVQQRDDLELVVGDTASFNVAATAEAGTFYYEVVSRGRVVFTSSARDQISFKVTPAMAPSAKLLVYQILPNSEVAADSLPFDVTGEYPQKVSASFAMPSVKPGDEVKIDVQTEGRARGEGWWRSTTPSSSWPRTGSISSRSSPSWRRSTAAAGRAARGRVIGGTTVIPGAQDTFNDAGLIVLSNKDVPEGKKIEHR